MSKPVINFEDFSLPFTRSPYPEQLDDSEEQLSNRRALATMRRAIPANVVSLGSIREMISDRPGFDCRVEEHFYLVPAPSRRYEWALIRIAWNDNDECYEWAEDARGSGFGDAKATGRALAAAMFERWEFDLTSDDYKSYRKFLKRLEK